MTYFQDADDNQICIYQNNTYEFGLIKTDLPKLIGSQQKHI